MKPRILLRTVVVLVVLAAMGVGFYEVIWVPLYRDQQAVNFVSQWNEPASQVDIEREDGSGTKSWSLKDQAALSKLREGMQSFRPGQEKPPQVDQKFRLRVRRSDARVDEYEVLLDSKSSDRDMLYVVRRTGGATVYGSAYNTPELRSALKDLIKEPSAAPK